MLTIARNVPLNDRLAAVDADVPGALDFWRHYLTVWTSANTARAGLSVLATVLLLVAVLATARRSS